MMDYDRFYYKLFMDSYFGDYCYYCDYVYYIFGNFIKNTKGG